MHRNLLKKFHLHVNVASVMVAEEDSQDLDGLTVGPDISSKETSPSPDRWTTPTSVPRLNTEQQDQLKRLLIQFQDTFSDTPGDAQVEPFTIETGEQQPVNSYPYRIPLKWQEKASRELRDLEDL